jgi:hypothetical protein
VVMPLNRCHIKFAFILILLTHFCFRLYYYYSYLIRLQMELYPVAVILQ